MRTGSSWTGRAGDVEVRDVLVEEAHERPHEPALGLALLAEEEQVVPGEDGDRDLGDDGVVVADDAGKERLVGLERGEEVVAEFVLDGLRLPAASRSCLRVVGRGAVTDSPLVRIHRIVDGEMRRSQIAGLEARCSPVAGRVC